MCWFVVFFVGPLISLLWARSALSNRLAQPNPLMMMLLLMADTCFFFWAVVDWSWSVVVGQSYFIWMIYAGPDRPMLFSVIIALPKILLIKCRRSCHVKKHH